MGKIISTGTLIAIIILIFIIILFFIFGFLYGKKIQKEREIEMLEGEKDSKTDSDTNPVLTQMALHSGYRSLSGNHRKPF